MISFGILVCRIIIQEVSKILVHNHSFGVWMMYHPNYWVFLLKITITLDCGVSHFTSEVSKLFVVVINQY